MKYKICIVDDDLPILDAITEMLQLADYKTLPISNGAIIEKIEKYRPDLILLDVLISGVDGRDLARQLKQSEDTKNIPIIMLSAHPAAEKSTKEAGADDFLAKPFDIDDLYKKIEQFLR